MHSNLKRYFANKKLDNSPLISELRKVNKPADVTALIATSSFNGHEGKQPTYTIAPYYTSVPLSKTLLMPDAGLMEITKFYKSNLDTWFGPKVFETFILNKTYRLDICYSGSRLEFFNAVAEWSPFLREVIIDTCNFILTGRRDIHPNVLLELSRTYADNVRRHDGDVIVPELNVKQRFNWKDIENLTSEEFFTLWVGRKGGIQDLICSHKLMLGL